MYLVRAAAVTLALAVVSSHTQAQGFLRTITFDGPPVVPSGTDIGVKYYYEDSMTFTPIDSNGLFGREGGGEKHFQKMGQPILFNLSAVPSPAIARSFQPRVVSVFTRWTWLSSASFTTIRRRLSL